MDQASPDHIYRSIRGIESLTAYVIPTWTIMARFLVHQTWKVSNRKRVDLPVRANIGCTITAVPKGHWAHGVILSDDFSAIASKPDKLTEFRGDSRSRNYMLDLASVAEPFSIGQPRFGMEEYSDLLKLAIPDVFSTPMGGEKVTVVNKFLEAHPLVALPLYRVAYKAQMLDETRMFIDPCRRSSKSVVAFRVTSPDGRNFSDVDQKKSVSQLGPQTESPLNLQTRDSEDVFGTRNANPKGVVRLVPLDGVDRAGPLRDLLYSSSSGSVPDWNLGDILPADSTLKSFIQSEDSALCDMSAKTPVVNRLMQSPGYWHNMIASIDLTMRGFKEGTRLTRRPPTMLDDFDSYMSPQSPYLAEDPFIHPQRARDPMSIALSASPGQTPPQSSVASIPRSQTSPWPPRQMQSPSVPPRESTSAARIRTREAQTRLDPSSRPSMPRTRPRKQSEAVSSNPQASQRRPTPRPNAQAQRRQLMDDLPIADPMSYYDILVVSPTMRFLDGRHADGVDRFLKQRRIRLARQLHPDTAEGDSEMMGRINDAFDHVESLPMRLAYNKEQAGIK